MGEKERSQKEGFSKIVESSLRYPASEGASLEHEADSFSVPNGFSSIVKLIKVSF